MKTRFSSLVTVKKSAMQQSERVLQSANADLLSASTALKLSYNSLNDVTFPQSGSMSELLASKTLLESQRGVISHNKEWQKFAQDQVQLAKEKLKEDMIAYEKFSYLDLQEINKKRKEIQVQESKDLDEVALMTHTKKRF